MSAHLLDAGVNDYDVIVAGGGISGMAAAIEAARAGARVLVLEKDRALGGNARWAFGFDIEGENIDSLRATDGDGDPVLQRLLVAQFRPSIAWLSGLGVALEENAPGRFNFVPRQGDGGADAFEALATAFKAAGGDVLTECPLARLLIEGEAIAGVETGGAQPRLFRAGSVILATGSFGRNAAMKRRHLGPNGHLTGYYGSRYHDGDGIAAALAIGATLTDGVSIPAGACVFPPPFTPPSGSRTLGADGVASREIVPAEIQSLLIRPPIDGSYGVLLNRDGRRYVDESFNYTVIAIQTTRQPDAVGYFVFDSRGHAADARNLDCAARHGAPIYAGETIPGVLAQLSRWRGIGEQGAGQDIAAMAETIATFNVAVARGAGDSLEPPAAPDATPLDRVPFYAVPVVQGVNDMAGGLAVDGDMRVLACDGRPIHGLFAVGADGGRPYAIEHGGLGYGLVSGRVAGRRAAAMQASRYVRGSSGR